MFYPLLTPEKRGDYLEAGCGPATAAVTRRQQQNQTPTPISAEPGCIPNYTRTSHAGILVSFSAPSFCCLLFLITFPSLPADLQAPFQVRLPEAGACSPACCCLLVGHELRTAELTQRITVGGHCWTLTNFINTQVVAVGLFFKFTLIKISFIFKT